MADRTGGLDLNWLVRVPVDPMTYRSLGYLLLAFPLAIAYMTVLTVGFSLGLGLTVVLVGPLVLATTLLAVVAFAWFDGVLTQALLGADISPGFPSNADITTFVKDLFLGRPTWLGLMFLLWKIVIGFVSFVLIVTGLSVGIALMLSPVFYGEHVVLRYGVGAFPIVSLRDAVVAAGIGVVITYVTLACINALGMASRAVAEGLLQHDVAPIGE